MSNTTTPVVAATAKKTQFTFGVSERNKLELTEFRKDFTRPAAVKNAPPVPMSEKELIEVLFKVTTDRRFVVTPVMETVEVDGEKVSIETYDEEGNQVFLTTDLVEVEWEAIKARDYSESIAKTPTIEGLIASVRKYGAVLKLSEEAIQAMIDAATANPAAMIEG